MCVITAPLSKYNTCYLVEPPTHQAISIAVATFASYNISCRPHSPHVNVHGEDADHHQAPEIREMDQYWTSLRVDPANRLRVTAAATQITSPSIIDNWRIMLAD